MAAKRFFQSLFLLLLLNALVKPVWVFLIDRKVQLITGTALYGKYFALFSLTMVLNFLIDFGITIHYNRKGAASADYLQQHFSASFFLKILLGLLYALVLVLISFISHWDDWTLLGWLVLNQVILSMLLFLRANITAMQHYRTDAFFSVFDKLLIIFSCGAMIFFPGIFGTITIHAFAILQTAAALIACMAALIYVLLKGGINLTFPRKILDLSYLKATIPYAILVFLMATHNRFDAFLLERLHINGAYEAGIYAKAYRLLDVANMAGVLTTGFMLPYLSKHLAEKVKINSFVQQVLHLLMLAGIFIAACGIVFPQQIDRLVYHTEDNYSAMIMQYCLPAILAYYWIQVYGTILTAAGLIRDFIIAALCFMLMNTVLNVLLLPSFGARSCVWTALITQAGFAISLTSIVKFRLAVFNGFTDMAKYAFLFLFTCGLFYLGNKLSMNWLQTICLTGLLLVAAANVLKIFSLKDIKQVLNFNKEIS